MNPRLILIFLSLSFWCVLIEGSKHPGHGRPFGSSGPFLQLDETEDISTRDFFDKYVKTKKALIIRGMAAKSPAFESWSSDEYLKEIARPYENIKLLVETQKKESRDQEVISLTLNEFLNEYKTKPIYIVDEVPAYMKNDIVLPQQLQCGHASETLEQTMLWFSSGGTKSVTHTDDYENILCLFTGTKEIIMADYYKYRQEISRIIDEPRGSYSSMDVDKVDYEMFPGIENLEYYKVNMNAGDCVYIPFKWLHQVRSFDRNIAVNFWFSYEKIFGRNVFADECANNKLDLTKLLSKYNYTSAHNDFLASYKHYIMRQVNIGNRGLKDWAKLIMSNAIDTENINKIMEMIKEFFNLIDFNGDGFISDEEILDLDENSIEHTAGILNEIDELMYTRPGSNTARNKGPRSDDDDSENDDNEKSEL